MALLEIAEDLSPEDQQDVFREIANALRGTDRALDARRLMQAAERAPPGTRQVLLDEALAAARGMGEVRSRASALTEVVPLLPSDARPPVLSEALGAARDISRVGSRRGPGFE